MADIFLSYKREDRPRVEAVARALEAAGFTVWWDDRIGPSGEWDAQIEREIMAARAVIVLWTPLAVQSKWVRAEAHHGHDRGRLIPAKIEPCDVPIAFSLAQTADLTDWQGDAEHRQWRKLLAWVEDLVRRHGQAESSQHSEALTQASRHGVLGQLPTGEDILDGATMTARTPAGTCFQDAPGLPVMRVVPAGSFVWGATAGDPDAQPTEQPPKMVALAQPFAMSIYPVTFEEWDHMVANHGLSGAADDAGWGRGKRPVINVSWHEADAFAQQLSSASQERYSLPSEAMWEYACRGGLASPFGFVEGLSPELANFDSAAASVAPGQTTPVGTYPANQFGLYDMHGNVREWVADTWHDNYLNAPDGGLAWREGHSPMNVVRGGSWLDAPRMLRASARGRATTMDRANFIGFRIVRALA